MRKAMIWAVVLVCAVLAVSLTGDAAQPTAKPEIVTVQGTVDVGNLPLDPDGNLRVADQGWNSPKTRTMDLHFFEHQRNWDGTSPRPVNSLPPIILPPGFSGVAIGASSLDRTKADITNITVSFSSDPPPMRNEGGIVRPIFWEAGGHVPGSIRTYSIGGQSLLVVLNVRGPDISTPPPMDAEYIVHLYLSQ